MGTDHQRLADLRELGTRLHAGDADGNFDRHSRTASYCVCVGSGHSNPLLDDEARTGKPPLSLLIKVPRHGARGSSREFASKMFERTHATLPIYQNPDVLWTNLHRVQLTGVARLN